MLRRSLSETTTGGLNRNGKKLCVGLGGRAVIDISMKVRVGLVEIARTRFHVRRSLKSWNLRRYRSATYVRAGLLPQRPKPRFETRGRLLLRSGNYHAKDRLVAATGIDVDSAAVCSHDLIDDIETKPEALAASRRTL